VSDGHSMNHKGMTAQPRVARANRRPIETVLALRYDALVGFAASDKTLPA